MGKKLNIEVDEFGALKLFVDAEPIGLIWEGTTSIIDSVQFSCDHEISQVCTEIVFKNLLGGLFEAVHKEILNCMGDAVKKLKGLPVRVSMRFNSGLATAEDEAAWLDKYGKWLF